MGFTQSCIQALKLTRENRRHSSEPCDAGYPSIQQSIHPPRRVYNICLMVISSVDLGRKEIGVGAKAREDMEDESEVPSAVKC